MSQAMRLIKRGEKEFYVVDPVAGEEANVFISEYLSTDAGGIAANNLDKLPLLGSVE